MYVYLVCFIPTNVQIVKILFVCICKNIIVYVYVHETNS